MPSSITHTYFAIDVLDGLDQNIKEKINDSIKIYRAASNGPDPYFYTKYSRFGHTMHREKTGTFFSNAIKYIKNNNLQDNPDVLAYLYGNITHYVLDSLIHPLVYYKTGRYIKGREDRKKYEGKHGIMELAIDEYMITIRNNIKPYKFKIHDFSFPKIKISDELKGLIDSASYETYEFKNAGKIINRAFKNSRIIHRLFRYDKYGIKRAIYNFLDIITLKKITALKIASYKFDFLKYLYYFNFDKSTWFHPVDKEELFNYSFIELYVIAYKRAIDLISQVNKVLHSNQELDDIFNELNKSYLTGKSLDDTRKIQYFSY